MSTVKNFACRIIEEAMTISITAEACVLQPKVYNLKKVLEIGESKKYLEKE